ncbi:glycosyl transferase family 28 [Micromonospora sp. AP08]|uniref:glycosyltransferase n=1 Tax=Micromonospora sp. AP08 TaxID=2604467 RepID=UPI0011D84FDF|nr:glycosyltransferase [Micromonospora sp. AP08]TYB36756.1 glycosyl transferase family 28 [Micromonospora sp. AP08]
MTFELPRQRDRRTVPYVLVVVGTDVHRFDRLVGWLERWHAGRPGVRLVLQYGHSRTPALPEATPFLGHEELQRAMAEATLVVSHGGPATITEARRTGHLPIVVPRDPTHDEHVDNHQQLFSRRLGAAGMVRLCETEADLVAALDEGLAEPARFVLAADPGRPDPRAEAVARVGAVIDDLVARRVRQRAGGRRG